VNKEISKAWSYGKAGSIQHILIMK